ncbi:MAG: hypothetical protein AB201_02040 [Parcubacteria bacterium C7867-006]|nr:MAG: hypothetical protein AB201_02040 [Parcubacteria bacterium C7867-006]
MKKHIIIATYDGISTHYSGVGTIAKNLVFALTKLSDTYDFKVSIAYINVNKQSKVFNSQCFEDSYNLVNKTGGLLIPLCNSTKGESEWDMWRSIKEWDYASISLVTALNLTLKFDEENYIILNDTPFLFFAKYKELVNDKKLKCFYFPLSTGKNHAFGDEGWRHNRIIEETMCFDLIAKDSNSKTIALGKRFSERMSEDYGLVFNESDFLQNGLCFEKYNEFLDKKFNNEDLKKFGIEIDSNKKIIFSWGRCSIAKGFKELTRAWVNASVKLPDHFLVLQIPNNSGEKDYFDEVMEILSETSRYIVIDDFNPEIWRTILRTNNTDLVCIPSLMDPFPHTSIEAKLFSKDMNYITMISDIDGAVDAFNPDESIYIDPRDTELFADKIIHSSLMNYDSKRSIIDQSMTTIDKFDFSKIIFNFLKVNINL